MEKSILLEREKIIEVAVNLFCEKGYVGTSVRDISHALDVSIATIYYYFKNKEDLLFTIIESCGDTLLLNINKVINEYSDPLERFHKMLFRHICLVQEKKKWVRIYVEEQNHLSKRFKNIIYKQHRKIYDTYVDQLWELHRLNLIRFDSIPIVTFAIFGMANWCYRWYRENGEMEIEDVAQLIIDLFLDGVLKKTEGMK